MRENQRSTPFGAGTTALLLSATLFATPGVATEEARQAVTLWWVIFNHPEACGEVCDVDDFENPDVAASVVYASGQMTRRDGRTRLVASLYEQRDGFADELIGGPGLLDVTGAEIQVVVRSHGDLVPDDRLEQMTEYFDSNCLDLGGENECRDIQFAVHAPDASGPTEGVFWFPDLNGGEQVMHATSNLWRQAGGVRVAVETSVR